MAKHKIGDICEIVSGSTPKSDVADYWNGNIKWITPAELNDDSYIVNDTVRKITELAVQRTGLTPFPAGTVILSSRAPIGKVAIAGCEMYCNQGFKNLICSDVINNRYLYWFLKGKTEYLNSLGRGATFKEISKQIVAAIEIDIPSLEEQYRIVEQLEKTREIIALRKKQVAVFDNLIKTRFVEMFPSGTLPTRKLADASIKGPQNGFYRKGAEIDGNTPIIKMKQLFGNDSMETVKDCDLVSMTEKESNNFLLTENDLLFGRRSLVVEGAGKCKRVGKINRPMAFESSLLRVTLDPNVLLPRYVQVWFETNEGMASISSIRSVTTIAGIKGSDLANIHVPIANIELQKQFSTFANQIDKSKTVVQAALDKVQILFDSLMQQYFG